MSNDSYNNNRSSYEGYSSSRDLYANTGTGRSAAEEARLKAQKDREDARRAEELREARERVAKAPPVAPHQREQRDLGNVIDPRYVRAKITRPDPKARGVTVVIIDNSGSNKDVAKRIRDTAAYILASLHAVIADDWQIAIVYGSDHCDGSHYRQDVDFVYSDEIADKIMTSTTAQVKPASGGDEAEAFECLLNDVCKIDFGHVPVEKRQLILVTDVVGHGMGMHSDDGCPFHVDWRQSLERVNRTFGSFQLIGTSPSTNRHELQLKFITKPDRKALDFIDLQAIRELEHRLGIVPNAILFLISRQQGFQIAKLFLQFLYEKWLKDPVFGQATDLNAREAIRRFFKYLPELTDNEALVAEWERDIFMD